jgi:hypothetical protein
MSLPESLPLEPLGSSASAFLSVTGKKQRPLKGECDSIGHEDEIGVIACGWGVTAPTTTGSGHATGRHVYDTLHVDKYVDAASTQRLNALAFNEELESVTKQRYRLDQLNIELDVRPSTRRAGNPDVYQRMIDLHVHPAEVYPQALRSALRIPRKVP